MARPAAPGVASRGALLRDVTRLSNAILCEHARSTRADARLQDAERAKAELLEKLRRAEEELDGLQAQKKRESENDSELVSLQQRVGVISGVRTDVVRHTLAARADRDAMREKATVAHYACIGAAFELLRVAAATSGGTSTATGEGGVLADVALGDAVCVWTPDCVDLVREADALWKRSSNASMVARDCLAAALALHGMQVDAAAMHAALPRAIAVAHAAEPAAPFAPATATARSRATTAAAADAAATTKEPLDDPLLAPAASAYRTLGSPQLRADIDRASKSLEELTKEGGDAQKRCGTLREAMTRLERAGTASSSRETATVAARASRVRESLNAVASMYTQLKLHADAVQLVLTQARHVLDAIAPAPEPGTSDEGARSVDSDGDG